MNSLTSGEGIVVEITGTGLAQLTPPAGPTALCAPNRDIPAANLPITYAKLTPSPDYSGVTYAPEIPPSTRKFDAVMNDESSDARKATDAAISSGSPKRPKGMCT